MTQLLNLVSFRHAIFSFCLLAADFAHVHRSASAWQPDDDVGKLLLSQDFQTAQFHSMPGASATSGITMRNYAEHHAIEWQVALQGPAEGVSPVYENLKSADFIASFPTDQPIILHWSKGSHSDVTDFQPKQNVLIWGERFELESYGGRSSDGVMPYFNLASTGGGLVVALGWPGDWSASFESLRDGNVRVTAGLKRSRFRLNARENVRLPSVLVMSYRGDWIDGQNQLRRLMLNHFTPTTHAPMELMPVAASVHGMLGFNVTTEDNLISLANDIAALKLPLDTYWLDAGWNEGGFPQGQGNPNADPIRFPQGVAPVGDAVRAAGMRLVTWFEPERAMRGTWLEREHADWLLEPTRTPDSLRYMENDGFRLLDMGNSRAREWAIETVSKEIDSANIGVYRQDFNEYPAYFWHTEELLDEVGLREVRYVNGLYDFLDELARRHPRLIIDNCASGGRRLDFEMMRRSVVLWRSDSCWDDKRFPRNVQAMTYGLSLLLPLHGLGAVTTDDIALRSGMGVCASFAINFRDPNAVAALRQHLNRYLEIRPLFASDYYPLTDWSDAPKEWLAFQFHDPERGEGIVQAFCGPDVSKPIIQLKLRGLEAGKTYTLTDWDQPSQPVIRSGESLMEDGIEVASASSNRAIVVHYTISP